MRAHYVIVVIVAGFFTSLGLLLGCQNPSPQFQTPRIEAAPAPAPAPAPSWQGTRFDDILIPSSFEFDYDASYVSISGSGLHPRVADIRYTGDMPLSDTLSNVQQGMLSSGWVLASINGVDIKTLRFTKANEECQIIVRPADEGESTVILLRLYPRY